MRRFGTGLTLFCALLTTGCDKAAQEFAGKTAALLDEYQKRLTTEIADAEEYYQRFSGVEVRSKRERLNTSADTSRREMADKWAADLVEKKQNPNRIREQLLEVAKAQFDISQEGWLNEVDNGRVYLEKMEKLQQDKDKVEAVSKLLESLTKQRSRIDEGKEIGKFVEATKGEIDKKICADISKKIAAPDTTADRKKSLEQLKKDRKCADK